MFGRCVHRSPFYSAAFLGLLAVVLGHGFCPGAGSALAQDAELAQDGEDAESDEPQRRVVDRLVAVVDDDPIFLSDVDRLLALGLVEASPALDAAARRRVALDRLIEERLRLHEVERYELGTVPTPEVDRQVAALAESLGGEESLDRLLASQDMDLAALRLLLRRQLRILAYVEERLGPRVSVSDEQIGSYYEGELRPEMTSRGVPLPPLVEVSDAIRAVLRERALNREIEDWTDDLRGRAHVVDLLQRRDRKLPPAVFEVSG